MAHDFTIRPEDLGLVPSYGSDGDALDGVGVEICWATFNTELSQFETRGRSTNRDVGRYIEIFHNRLRHQSSS